MENKTTKYRTAKVAKAKEHRITNKKVESLHKYWEVFPGLKEKLIKPVEGENYSLIKPKDVEKAVYANADVKRFCEYASAVTFGIGTSLVFSLNHNKQDYIPEVMKNATKHEARQVSMDIPFVKWRNVLSVIETYWPLAEEYYKICKAGGIMACKKHPLFINYMRFSVADDLKEESEDIMPFSHYCCMAYLDYVHEKNKYVSLSEAEHEIIGFEKTLLDIEEDDKQIEETVMAEVYRRIEELDGLEYWEELSRAFFSEICDSIESQFKEAVNKLINKLSA